MCYVVVQLTTQRPCVLAPLAQKGDQCTERIVILVRGEPAVLPKVFTGYCPCSAGLSCTGNETKYCT